jgi:predicted DNA binding CopG/RHH family protein
MRDDYDFSKARKNPYARKIKKQITIRLEPEVIDYFKGLASENGIPYQTLINLLLRDCAQSGKKPAIEWAA